MMDAWQSDTMLFLQNLADEIQERLERDELRILAETLRMLADAADERALEVQALQNFVMPLATERVQ